MSATKPKILHVTFDMDIGGTEQVIKQIIGALADEYEFQVLCIDGEIGAMGRELEQQGHRVLTYDRRPGVDWGLVRYIRRLAREENLALVHGHQYTPWFYAATGAALTPARVLFTEHGRFFPDSHSWKRRLMVPVLLGATDAVTAISESTRQALARHEWIPLSRSQVIYNGIADPASRFRSEPELRRGLGFEDDDFVVGTVSRLDPIKNQAMMIDAFARAAEQAPNLKLLIVGDGPARRVLEARCRDLELDERVVFTGARSDALRFLALMDVFLLSSFSEGTSMTLLEAMALGKPCVATDVGGNPEVLADGGNATLTPSGDVEAFAEAMLELHRNADRRTSFACASRARYLQSFTVGSMVAGYRALYGGSL